MKKIAARTFLLIVLAWCLFAPHARAQDFVFADTGTFSAATTLAAKMTFGESAMIFLDITTLTLADADDEVDFYIQTTYDGETTWVDLQNIHFSNSDNGSTAAIVAVITPDLDGPGTYLSFTGTDPGVGIEIIETVPTNTIWRLWGGYATLVTDAGVANRRANIYIDDGTNNIFRSVSSAIHTASNTETYTIGPHAVAVDNHWIPTPPGMVLLAGWRFQTSTALIEAGDNWSAPQLTIEKWADPENSTDGTMGDNLKAYRPMGSEIRIKVLITGASAPTYAFTARGIFR